MGLALCALCATSKAQWLPITVGSNANWISVEPTCNAKRKQVRVKLLDGTHFVLGADVKAGAVLYAVRFIDTGKLQNNPPVAGLAYCEPKKLDELGTVNAGGAIGDFTQVSRSWARQCLYDYNADGVFDDGHLNGYFNPARAKPSASHQYRYEVMDVDGSPEPGCPRVVDAAKGPVVNQLIWAGLGGDERAALAAKGAVEVLPSNEVGVVVQSQQADRSTPGTNGGARLGEQVAAAAYIDRSVSNGSYSAKGQLGAQVLGAVLGSTADASAVSAFVTRYTVRTVSGEMLTADKSSPTNDFSVANGVCVVFPSIQQVDQAACESSLDAFKAKFFPGAAQAGVAKPSREVRLRELKELFDKGLVSEKVFLEQQKSILDN